VSASQEDETESDPGGWGGFAGLRRVVGRTITQWDEDGAVQAGAAVAYYAMISLAPLVVLAVTLLGRFVGSGTAEQQILDQVGLLAGPRGVELARIVLQEAGRPDLASLQALLTVAVLLFGATAVFANLQNALNRIWAVEPRSGMVRNLVRTRVAAFTVVLGLGVLMFVSVVVGAVVGWVGPLLQPLERILPFVRVVDVLTSFFLLWLFVGFVFKVLPDAVISWRDVWLGSLVTAGLLVLGKELLALFLARNAFASMYGTAGSFLLLLLWVYYSAQVLFLGAEFTQVWAEHRGRRIRPETYAVRVERVRSEVELEVGEGAEV
jgi:membrane protein